MTATRGVTESEIKITPSIRSYVEEFILTAGYAPRALGNDDVYTVFKLLARLEEYETDTKHKGQNWDLAFAAIGRREQFLSPVLEQLCNSWAATGKVVTVDASEKWPHGKRFALCLTHDIDILHEYPGKYAQHVASTFRKMPFRTRAFALGKLGKYIINSIRSGGRCHTPPLDAWIEAEAKHGFSSTMHFMANHISPSWQDGYYGLDDRVDFAGRRLSITEIMRQLDQNGWDIGLHGGALSSQNSEVLCTQKEFLEEAAGVRVTSTRQHYLFYDIRKTPAVQIAAGLTVDSTMGSNQNTDFRCGTGLPFYIFNLATGQASNLLELPLIIQDVVLARLMAGDEDLMIRSTVQVLERVAAINGCVTLLWHNHFRPDSLQFRVYERILKEAAELEAWGCSMRDLEIWWRHRTKIKTQHRVSPKPRFS